VQREHRHGLVVTVRGGDTTMLPEDLGHCVPVVVEKISDSVDL
jgi:hypothetical protein